VAETLVFWIADLKKQGEIPTLRTAAIRLGQAREHHNRSRLKEGKPFVEGLFHTRDVAA
jgi:hypothetical protein